MLDNDTIAAIATPRGNGGIAIVRLSGTQSKDIIKQCFKALSKSFVDFKPWTMHRGHFFDTNENSIDDVLVVHMPAPRTFTGEEIVEVHCHGGDALVRLVLETLLHYGARLAEHGEFSRRALLNGRMDLTQAEAVAEMISAPTKAALRLNSAKLDGLLGQRINALREKLENLRMALCIAVDFPEEEVECLSHTEFYNVVLEVRTALDELLESYKRHRYWQEGANVVLAGAVNVGKSSLLNAFLGHNRALVTDIAGTTRDFLEEYINLDGLAIRITDTAGLRYTQEKTDDVVENMGIARTHERIKDADCILLILDAILGEKGLLAIEDEALKILEQDNVIIVWNKTDLTDQTILPNKWQEYNRPFVHISAKTGQGLQDLSKAIHKCLLKDNAIEPQAGELSPNLRQAQILEQAYKELSNLMSDIENDLPYDVCAVALDVSVSLLAQITGIDAPDELLDRIFSTFCIGK